MNMLLFNGLHRWTMRKSGSLTFTQHIAENLEVRSWVNF